MRVKQQYKQELSALRIPSNDGASYDDSEEAVSPSNSPSMLLQTPDPMMKFWGNILSVPFFPKKQTTVSKLLNRIFVTPLTNVTFFSMFYQLYLNEIFHTKFYTRLTHIVNMPLHVLCCMILLNQVELYRYEKNEKNNFTTRFPEQAPGIPSFYAINFGLLFALCLLTYYTVWGILSRL